MCMFLEAVCVSLRELLETFSSWERGFAASQALYCVTSSCPSQGHIERGGDTSRRWGQGPAHLCSPPAPPVFLSALSPCPGAQPPYPPLSSSPQGPDQGPDDQEELAQLRGPNVGVGCSFQRRHVNRRAH